MEPTLGFGIVGSRSGVVSTALLYGENSMVQVQTIFVMPWDLTVLVMSILQAIPKDPCIQPIVVIGMVGCQSVADQTALSYGVSSLVQAQRIITMS